MVFMQFVREHFLEMFSEFLEFNGQQSIIRAFEKALASFDVKSCLVQGRIHYELLKSEGGFYG